MMNPNIPNIQCVYVAIVTFYDDDMKHMGTTFQNIIRVFKKESDANKWVKTQLILESLDCNSGLEKSDFDNMSIDDIRETYLQGEFVSYKVNYDVLLKRIE